MKASSAKSSNAPVKPDHIIAVAASALAGGIFIFAGCTSKSKAQADARTAFLAGQQESMMRMQQPQTPVVTVQGRVRNNVVPWTEDLTVAKAIVAAEYYGHTDPVEIILVRQRYARRIDARKLLSGEDVPVQPGDIIELR